MGGAKKPPPQFQTVGTEYRLDMSQHLCLGPVDAIKEIQVDEETVWTGEVTTEQQIIISAHDIFGGIKKEGGVSGAVDVLMGTSTQGINPYMGGKVGAFCPAYRNIAAFVLKQFYIGNSTYTKPWKTKVERIQNTIDGQDRWYPSKAEIGDGQMNPAHIIEEIITDTVFGLAEPKSKIGDSFTYSADLLYDEVFGLSYVFDSGGQDLMGAVSDILTTIDGVVYVDPSTGKFELKLARGDYDPELIPTVTQDDIIEFREFTRPTPSKSANKITLTYTDHQTGKPKTVSVADTASYYAYNSIITQNIEYASISTQALATAIASRECDKQGARPFSLNIVGNSNLSQYRPMDVFKLNYPDLGIENKVVRVLEVGEGAIDDQKVSLRLIEDIYALGFGVITGEADNKSTPAASDPEDVDIFTLIELPYYVLAKDLFDEPTMETSTDLESGIMILAQEPTSDSNSYFVAESDTTGNTEVVLNSTYLFNPTGELSANIDYGLSQVITTLNNPNDIISANVPGFGYIGNEFIWIEDYDFNTSQITFQRAVLDTLPEDHLAGDLLYFIKNSYGYTYENYLQGSNVFVKMLTDTPLGTLALDDATERSYTNVDVRYLKPYRPRDLQQSWVGADPVNGELRLDWKHSNRLEDVADVPLFHSDPGDTLEVGASYNLKITKRYDDLTPDDVVTVTGITDDFYTLTETPPLADDYDIELETERDSIVSLEKWEVTQSR